MWIARNAFHLTCRRKQHKIFPGLLQSWYLRQMIVKRWTEVLGVLLNYDLNLNQVMLFQLENEVAEMDEEAYVDG